MSSDSNAARTATAFAPASVANVAVGFDILGFPVDCLGDRVQVTRQETPGIQLQVFDSPIALPLDPAQNTATAGLLELMREHSVPGGFKVSVHKGIPIGSGLGGSAASSVAALVAANALLDRPLSKEALFKYALSGEFVASGSRHADNVAPCLFGGLVLTESAQPVHYVRIPVPSPVLCVLVHPHLVIETKAARQMLKKEIALSDHVRQSRNLAAFVAGCYRQDFEMLRRSLNDVLIEPRRAPLIPGFFEAKEAALQAGALGFSISGSGPTVFAWADSRAFAEAIQKSILNVFKSQKLGCESWITPLSLEGARLIA